MLSQKSIISLYKELSLLLSLGTPLLNALQFLANKEKNPKIKKILLNIQLQCLNGSPLSSALKSFPSYFDPLSINSILTGENSGNLPAALADLSSFKQNLLRLKQKISSLLIYPTFVLFAALALSFIISQFVIPKFHSLLPNLPPQSNSSPIPYLTLFLLLLPALLFYQKKRHPLSFAKSLLSIPILGPFLRNIQSLLFLKSLSLLLKNKTPLPLALELSAAALSNPLSKKQILYSSFLASKGRSLISSLSCQSFLPQTYSSLLQTAEETGQLLPTLSYLIDDLESTINQSYSSLTAFLEPASILLLALLILSFLSSLISPLLHYLQNLPSF